MNETPSDLATDPPAVSVVVPALNAARWMGGCVESLLSSRFPGGRMEIICVDNGSTDDTLKILQSFGATIQIEQVETRGPAAARNAGLRRAVGEFVAFTDADCIVDPDWVANLIEPLRTNHCCVAGGRIVARTGAGAVERFGQLVHNHQQAIECDSPPYLIGMNMAARRSLLLSIGGFDERWLRTEDVEITYRLLAVGCTVVYCPKAIITHYNRDTLATLMREGFLHGFYHPALVGAYGDFMHEFRRPVAISDKTMPIRETPDPQLSPFQVDLLWRAFRFAKGVGRFSGSLFPPVRVQ